MKKEIGDTSSCEESGWDIGDLDKKINFNCKTWNWEEFSSEDPQKTFSSSVVVINPGLSDTVIQVKGMKSTLVQHLTMD